MAFLLPIPSARRVGELQALSCKDPYLNILENRVIIKPDPMYVWISIVYKKLNLDS